MWHLEYDRHILEFNYCPLIDTYFQCKFKNRTFCHQLILQDAELPLFTLISSEFDSSDWQPDDLCLSKVPSLHDFLFFRSWFPKCLAYLLSVKSGQDKVSGFLAVQAENNTHSIGNQMKCRLAFIKSKSEKKWIDRWESPWNKLVWWILICGVRSKRQLDVSVGQLKLQIWMNKKLHRSTYVGKYLNHLWEENNSCWYQHLQNAILCKLWYMHVWYKENVRLLIPILIFFRNPTNFLVWSSQKQMDTSVGTRDNYIN